MCTLCHVYTVLYRYVTAGTAFAALLLGVGGIYLGIFQKLINEASIYFYCNTNYIHFTLDHVRSHIYIVVSCMMAMLLDCRQRVQRNAVV